MIVGKGRCSRQGKQKLAKLMLASLLVASFAGISSLSKAEAILISSEEHWSFIIDRWDWDPVRYRNFGIIDPTIVIVNETTDRIDGYIGDANGTRLFMYNDEQVVLVRYIYNSGLMSNWDAVTRLSDGYFTVLIPDRYRDADIIDLYIGNNQYTVKDGTWTTHQTLVQINSARLKYQTDSLLEPELPETTVAAVQDSTVSTDPCSSSGSLIDRILCIYKLKVQTESRSLIAVALSSALVQKAV